MEKGSQRPHIAFLPTPGMGHLIPISELAKLLVDRHQFTVTIITFSESQNRAQEIYLSSLPTSISSLSLPPIPLSDLPHDARIETRISAAAARCVPHLRSLLLSLASSTRLVAFVADLFATHACDAARDLSIPHHIFIPTNLLYLTLMLQLPALHAASPLDFHQLEDPVRLAGFPPIPGSEILHPLQDRKNECYRWLLEHSVRYLDADGILVNTFDAIEPEAAKLLTADEPGRPPVYPVGPLIRSKAAAGEEGAQSLKWLDDQPPDSVLFVSFGSGGALSAEQTEELALGLEASGQRFLWVVRSPSRLNSAAYFTGQIGDDPLAHLPEGFLERTAGVGLAVPSWAPQVEVLGHPAVGGFLSHCGWNSTLESAAHGVPIIAWPLFAEQRMNAVVLVEGTKVAMPLKQRKDGVYERREIARVAREMMEGEEGKLMRRRAKELAAAAAAALLEEGSSSIALLALAERWKSFEAV
ncbi:Hydroquinone glucosyltransferase [Platanthera zijinensis]|uniref:Glycosyltransferase n=1 Tax=Platanthera zijinensis TaxID=2320716 RepID=A0AAP0BHX2_9ASPA